MRTAKRTRQLDAASNVKCEVQAHAVEKEIQFHDGLEGIQEWPMNKNFPPGEISYRLNNFSPDFATNWQIRAVTVALRTWQLRIDKLKFRRERNPTAHVDADIWWRPNDYFASANVLAHAWYPGQGSVSGDVEINDSWHYVPGVHLAELNQPPLVPILVHEFGHGVIGLTHDPTSEKEIMYPSFNLGRRKTGLGSNDVFRSQRRHGARRMPQHIIDYFLNRRKAGWDFK